ncbi:TonB-dependent receptor [Butyricimonas paravirosa]|uniref:TonB-dependent receptor n=1 Tax=Butyricimonas paravirosa TaxID=1472417 RepID=UPI00242BCCA8|nr:TonB-dependent receptor [Butyricimonas paravirosa]
MKKMFDSWGSHVKKIPLQGLLCLFILCLSLPLHAQNEEGKININVKDASVKEVLEVLKKYNYRLVYSTAVIDACKKKITLDMKKATPSQVLDEIFKETNLVYKIEGNLITIKEVKKDESLVAQGVVKDENGEPIPGVSVLIKGTVTGTATDNKGNFQLKVAKNSALIFSFLGMETKTVFIESEKPIQVVMKEKTNEMEEVVITGYQKINKRESTSSIVTMKAEDIIEPIGNRLDQMLQGKIPGMAVLQQSSTVGASPKIRIRGSSSIIGNREPVWVLDGIILEDPVPLDVTELNSMDNVNLIGNAISGLNPEDIERIDVLKDASATAIYGVKAANGVIVITTKRGKLGEPVLRYTTSMSLIARPTTDMMRLMNSKERVEVSEEIVNRGLQTVSGVPVGTIGYEGLIYQLWHNEITRSEFDAGVKELKEMNTDWYKLLFRNSFSHSHTLSLSGATDKVGYYFSFGFSDQQGASLKESSNRFNFMSNLDARLFHDKLNVSLSLSASTTNGSRPYIDLYKYAFETSRSIPAYNEDGTLAYYAMKEGEYGSDYLMYNVINELNETGSKNRTNSLNVSMNLSSKLTDWLSWDAVVGYNTSAYKQNNWATDKSYKVSALRRTAYGYEPQGDDLKDFKSHSSLPFGGILDEDYTNNTSYTVRTSLSFNKLWNDHSVSASAGLEVRGSKYDGTNSESYGYLHDRGKKFIGIDPVDYTGYANYSKSNVPTVMDNTTNNMSYYATFAYGFRGRYVLSANVRGDASNKLGQDKSARFLPIWSFSGRWNVADESFMQNVNWVNDLSFRASYGLQGNVTDAHNPNMIISLGSLDTKSMQYIATLSSLPNPGLKWEKTTSINLGLDFSLFKGAISATVEYYTKKGKDQLISASVPSTNGATSVMLNAGTMSNKGWELSIMATPVKTKDFAWSVSFNTSKNYNKVTNSEYESVETYNNYINGSLIRNGKSINSFYSYRYTGLDESGLPTFAGVRATDDEGNVIISSREEALAAAFVYSGKREPDFTGGLSMNFKWKSISLNTLFAMSLGAKVRLNDLYQESGGRIPYPESNMSSEFVNRWKEPGDEKYTDIPVLTDVSPSINSYAYLEGGTNVIASNIWQMYNKSDLRVVDGSFLRCKSISLTYSLPKSFLSKCYIKSASIGLGVSNPFVIKSKDLKGRDPEQSTLGSGAIPPQSTYSFSLNVSF